MEKNILTFGGVISVLGGFKKSKITISPLISEHTAKEVMLLIIFQQGEQIDKDLFKEDLKFQSLHDNPGSVRESK